VTTTGHDIRALEMRKADLNAAIHLAQADVARLGAAERIEQRAREMGMVPAERRVYVTIEQPLPATGMPARYLNEEVASASTTTVRPWWKSLLSRLPMP
jgi:hypothetical protein